MTEDLMAFKKLRKAGFETLVAERMELYVQRKRLDLDIQERSAKIAKLMVVNAVDKAQAGPYVVNLVSDASYEKFDRDSFLRDLVEHGVSAKLLQSAVERHTEKLTKKPFLKISGGGDADE